MTFEEAACEGEGFKEAEETVLGNKRLCSGGKLMINTVIYRTWERINIPRELRDRTGF